MLIREIELKDIAAVLPLYISYYNEQENSCWNENTARKRIHQVLSMEDSYELIVENEIAYEYQNKGIGSMLLRELEQRVKDKGASCVELQAVNDDMHERYYGKAG